MDRLNAALLVYLYAVVVLFALLALVIVSQAVLARLADRPGSRRAPPDGRGCRRGQQGERQGSRQSGPEADHL